MAATWTQVEAARDRLVEVAREVGPHAPTLCAGWTCQDVVAHLLVLQSDPLSWPVAAFAPLEPLAQFRMRRALADGWTSALDRLGTRSPRIWPMLDDTARRSFGHHLGEYLVHTEDIVRANAVPSTTLDPGTDAAAWDRAVAVAPQLSRSLRRRGVQGLVLTSQGRSASVLTGADPVAVTGPPLDLLVWLYRPAAPTTITIAPLSA